MTIRSIPKPDRYARPEERIDYSDLALPKRSPQADARFREITRGKGCQVRRRSPQLHAHCSPVRGAARRPVIDFCHIPAERGLGQKASDVGNGIGMCHDLHMEQHTIGWPAFAKQYGIDPKAIAAELAEGYTSGRRS